MPPRSLLAPVLAALVLVSAAAPAAAFGPGTTFLAGALDLPGGAIGGAGLSGYSGSSADRVSVSDDGRYVAFASMADGLDAAAGPDVANTYRKDLLTGEVVLVSRATGANGVAAGANSSGAVISDDGSRVAFKTVASLDPADADGALDVYVRDVDAGTTTLASVGPGGATISTDVPAFDLSGDGRFVAFQTDLPFDPLTDRNGVSDVFVRDLLLGATTLASSPDGSLAAGNGASYTPAISDDGRWVAFVSDATNLGAVNAGAQLFARDRTLNRTVLVSADATNAARGGNGQASEPDIAGAPGAASTVTVAYTSTATNVASGGVDGSADYSVYVRRLSSTPATLVSRADGAAGANADSRAHTPSISDDGTRVVFDSDAANLGAGSYYYGTYLRNLTTSSTVLASTDNRYAVQGAISDDGSLVAWVNGTGVTADSDPDLYGVFARTYGAPATLGAPQFVSRPAGSAPFLASAFYVGEPTAGARAISGDGRYVVLVAYGSRLPGAVMPFAEAYRRDTLTGALELVSRADGPAGAAAAGSVAEPTISADGSRVAFTSAALNLEAGTGRLARVYVRDFAAGTTTLASRADGAGGAPADGSSGHARISADGRHVAFLSNARDLGDPTGAWHVYLRDAAAGTTTLVDRATGAGGALADGGPTDVQLSGDGRYVLFRSTATNLDPADGDRLEDLYVRDTAAGTTTLVSRANGLAGAKAAGGVGEAAISADGAAVAFETSDETLAPEAGGWGGTTQVVVRTLATGANVLASRVAGGGAPANDDAGDPSLSADGSVVAFDSTATNLLPGLGGGVRAAVFARSMASGALSGPPAFGLIENTPQNGAVTPSLSDNGQCMAFTGQGHNAATGFAGDFATAYVYVVSGACPKPLPVVVPPLRRTARPALSKVSLSHRRFRVGRRATARAAAARRRARRAPVGTTFRFTLNGRANVAIAFERQAPGRLVGRFCRRPSARLRRHLRCVRFVRVGRLSRGGLRAGANRVAFSGRIGRRALKPGAYRARLRASNAGGTSAWARVAFRVVK